MENETGLKLFFWVGTAIMAVLALLVLFITLLYHKKVHTLKEKEAENLLRVSLESEKKERRRIASDLHDGITGDLNAVRNYIALLSQNEDNSDNESILREVKTSLDTTLAGIRGISYNLMPPLLEEFGLAPTLNDYFERVQKLNQVSITTHYYQKDLPVPTADAYELYRIVQELVTNMIRYGKVQTIHFSFVENNRTPQINITDDGAAFDFYENLKSSSGLGLKNILTRAKHIGARLEQVPTPRGNRLIIHLKNPTL